MYIYIYIVYANLPRNAIIRVPHPIYTLYIYMVIYIYICSEFIHWALWETLMRSEYFCSFTTPQAFWKSSAPGPLSTLVKSVVLYSLTRATLMSPGKNETRVCGYVYTSRLAGRFMLNWEYTGICCYLTSISLHLPILSIWFLHFIRFSLLSI